MSITVRPNTATRRYFAVNSIKYLKKYIGNLPLRPQAFIKNIVAPSDYNDLAKLLAS